MQASHRITLASIISLLCDYFPIRREYNALFIKLDCKQRQWSYNEVMTIVNLVPRVLSLPSSYFLEEGRERTLEMRLHHSNFRRVCHNTNNEIIVSSTIKAAGSLATFTRVRAKTCMVPLCIHTGPVETDKCLNG